MQFFNVGKASVRIAELETQLGIPAGPKILKIRLANARIQELEQMLAAEATQPKPQPSAPAAASVTIAPAPKPEQAPAKLTGMAAVRADAQAAIKAEQSRPAPNFTRQALPAVECDPEQVAQRPTRAQCAAILKIVQPTAAAMPEAWTDAECFAEVERACFQAHVTIPGMRGSAELSNEYWRAEKPTGMALYMQAERKRKISAILAAK